MELAIGTGCALLGLVVMTLPGFALASRARRMRRFVAGPPRAAVGFGAAVWGVPDDRGVDVSPLTLLLVYILAMQLVVVVFFGSAYLFVVLPGIRHPILGLALTVIPTLGALGWVRHLIWRTPLTRLPRFRRLRFEQNHVTLDWCRCGWEPDPDELLEATPSRGHQARIVWDDVRAVQLRDGHVVVEPTRGDPLRFGPVSSSLGQAIVAEASARLGASPATDSGIERSRLRDLQSRATRT